jgi:hypothetical protein
MAVPQTNYASSDTWEFDFSATTVEPSEPSNGARAQRRATGPFAIDFQPSEEFTFFGPIKEKVIFHDPFRSFVVPSSLTRGYVFKIIDFGTSRAYSKHFKTVYDDLHSSDPQKSFNPRTDLRRLALYTIESMALGVLFDCARELRLKSVMTMADLKDFEKDFELTKVRTGS